MDLTVKGSLSIFLITLSLLCLGKIITKEEKKDYAYINYDGGYTALGYISGINYEMNVYMEDDEGQNYAGNRKEVLDVLKSFNANDTIKKGIFLKFNNAYKYSGSVKDFTLRVNTSKNYSDGTIKPESWLEMIESTELDEKSDYKQKATSNLYFESAPGGQNPLAFIKNLLD